MVSVRNFGNNVERSLVPQRERFDLKISFRLGVQSNKKQATETFGNFGCFVCVFAISCEQYVQNFGIDMTFMMILTVQPNAISLRPTRINPVQCLCSEIFGKLS